MASAATRARPTARLPERVAEARLAITAASLDTPRAKSLRRASALLGVAIGVFGVWHLRAPHFSWVLAPALLLVAYALTGAPSKFDVRRAEEIERFRRLWKLTPPPPPTDAKVAGYRAASRLAASKPTKPRRLVELAPRLERILEDTLGGTRVDLLEVDRDKAYLAVFASNGVSASDAQAVAFAVGTKRPAFTIKPRPQATLQPEDFRGIDVGAGAAFLQAFVVEGDDSPKMRRLVAKLAPLMLGVPGFELIVSGGAGLLIGYGPTTHEKLLLLVRSALEAAATLEPNGLPAPPPATLSPRVPWEDETLGFAGAYLSTARLALGAPSAFFTLVAQRRTAAPAALFAAVGGGLLAISAMVTEVFYFRSLVPPGAKPDFDPLSTFVGPFYYFAIAIVAIPAVMPLLAYLSPFLLGGAQHLALRMLGAATAPYDATVRGVSYASAANALAVIPVVGAVAPLAHVALTTVALEKTHKCSRGVAFLATVAPLVALAIIAFAVAKLKPAPEPALTPVPVKPVPGAAAPTGAATVAPALSGAPAPTAAPTPTATATAAPE